MTHVSALMTITLNPSIAPLKSPVKYSDASKHKGFWIFHCNIRILEKNKSLLRDILGRVKVMPVIIAI